MKAILATLVVLFAGVRAEAQTPIAVRVSTGDAVEQKITDQLKAKIGGASRYAVSDEPGVASLTVDVNCVSLGPEGGPVAGYACQSVVAYFPHMGALSKNLPGAETLVACNTGGKYCADALFDAFADGTQADKLATAKSELQRFVDQYVESMQSKEPRYRGKPKSEHTANGGKAEMDDAMRIRLREMVFPNTVGTPLRLILTPSLALS